MSNEKMQLALGRWVAENFDLATVALIVNAGLFWFVALMAAIAGGPWVPVSIGYLVGLIAQYFLYKSMGWGCK